MGSFKILNDSFIGVLIIFLTASLVSLICAQSINNEADYEMNVLNNRFSCSVKNLINPPPLEGIKGTLQWWPTPSVNADTDLIAFIRCDDIKNVISAADSASAILLYSDANPCSFRSISFNFTIPIFITDQKCYDDVSKVLVSTNQVAVEIKGGINFENVPGTKDNSPVSTNGSSGENKVLATYQTAMIVLYAVSGVVLGLFFIVVVTNIIKNRLNAPAPQTSQGQDPRPRRGIARSVLESFPVFFFTMGLKDEDDDKKEKDDLEKGKAKELESDIELESLSTDVMKSAPQAEDAKDSSNISTDKTSKASNNNNDDNSQESDPDLPQNPSIAHIKDSSRSRSISTTSNPSATLTNNEVQDGQLTCPICIDDFESGEELRLLPCQHRYHTLCIDPWLLDISPLCPMCKTDYTSWESEMNATQHNQDSSVSSSIETTGNNHYTTHNENQRNDDDSSVASSVHHNFPHFRWIKYLTAIRRRRRHRDRRSSRQSRIAENNNNNRNSQNSNVVGTVITS
ncbi:unnamed protein product [Rhizophagus irregularis]|uniref:RING-type domain-containing protein n=1 Tax=Rhizophagus irregularis TaxID=588596 RepID=A0A2I1G8F9_9GLOM|nr:hypothetical protein RhiirA4_398095 [Rhizophagus irregularis]CAB4422291.1 unnamed protein product [Rhizophagus irregularis]